MKILIICASNICRSPFVEFILRREVNNDPSLKDKIQWIKSSAVINKMFRIHPRTKKALIKEGFNEDEIDMHRPSHILFDYKRFKDADIIVGMKKNQRLFLPRKIRGKFVTLSEAAGAGEVKISDPFFAKDEEGFDLIMRELKNYSVKFLKNLRKQLIQ
ncbi:MAG: hypothetical protein ACOX3U_06975 [Christensenellales bacterium]|jgi:protein-tyrosine-phosphatase